MINFLRKLRLRSASSKGEIKSARYLINAVREIFLVVIGILIALGLNDWSSYHSDRNREKIDLIGLMFTAQSQKAEGESKDQEVERVPLE
ncbi:MAG: hypothetical protein ACJAS3_000608 [Roseivirga sp.]|jgi:hypothetical protein